MLKLFQINKIIEKIRRQHVIFYYRTPKDYIIIQFLDDPFLKDFTIAFRPIALNKYSYKVYIRSQRFTVFSWIFLLRSVKSDTFRKITYKSVNQLLEALYQYAANYKNQIKKLKKQIKYLQQNEDLRKDGW